MTKMPEGFHAITPHFVVSDARKAIDLYKAALGAEEVTIMQAPGSDMIMHAAIKVGNSMMFLSDPFPGGDREPPAGGTLSSNAFYHYVADVDAAYAKAVAAGMTGKSEPEDMFWGDRTAVVTDGFGYNWTLATFVREASDEEMAEAIKSFAAEG